MKTIRSLSVHSAPDLALALVGVDDDGKQFRMPLTRHSALHLIADLSRAVAASSRVEEPMPKMPSPPPWSSGHPTAWKHNKSRGE